MYNFSFALDKSDKKVRFEVKYKDGQMIQEEDEDGVGDDKEVEEMGDSEEGDDGSDDDDDDEGDDNDDDEEDEGKHLTCDFIFFSARWCIVTVCFVLFYLLSYGNCRWHGGDIWFEI